MGYSVYPVPSSGGTSNLTTSDLATYSSSQTRLSRLQVNSTGVPSGIPAGTTTVFALVAGGGGGGRGGAVNQGGTVYGGGAGGVAFGWVPYISNFVATVGAGGNGGTTGTNNGNNGGSGGASHYAGMYGEGGGGGSSSPVTAAFASDAVFSSHTLRYSAASTTGDWLTNGRRPMAAGNVNLSNTWAGDGGQTRQGFADSGAGGLYAGGATFAGNVNGNITNGGTGGGGGGIISAGNAASANAGGNGGSGGGGGGAGNRMGFDSFNGGNNASPNAANGGSGGAGAVVIYY